MLVLIYTNDGSLIIYFKFPNNFFSHTFNPWFGVGGVGGGGGRDSHMKGTGMLVVLRRGVNFGF